MCKFYTEDGTVTEGLDPSVRSSTKVRDPYKRLSSSLCNRHLSVLVDHKLTKAFPNKSRLYCIDGDSQNRWDIQDKESKTFVLFGTHLFAPVERCVTRNSDQV